MFDLTSEKSTEQNHNEFYG